MDAKVLADALYKVKEETVQKRMSRFKEELDEENL